MSRNHVFPPSAGDFLLASRRCEITVLQQLLQMGLLVGRVSQLIHVLQRERGTVNIYLCSQGALFGERLAGRAQQVELAAYAQRQCSYCLGVVQPRGNIFGLNHAGAVCSAPTARITITWHVKLQNWHASCIIKT